MLSLSDISSTEDIGWWSDVVVFLMQMLFITDDINHTHFRYVFRVSKFLG